MGNCDSVFWALKILPLNHPMREIRSLPPLALPNKNPKAVENSTIPTARFSLSLPTISETIVALCDIMCPANTDLIKLNTTKVPYL